ncbi:MAG: adenosylcobinamide-GDP ribazoletransferase [Ilumatobacteraceae bacterium]|nr:adenosylcobinamide-GDP ribazoletransferase [Ilumatobacteraceae bacterium]
MSGFLGAVQFLTRVPIRLRAPVDHARVVPWFGVVGVLIGAAVGGVAAGLTELVPVAVAAACAVAAGLLITGAFHEDGLADIADAFGGGWTVERRLEILKDSRHGTYGVAALSSSIVLRVVCAASIAGPAALFAAFVAAHGLGRVSAVAAMKAAPPATESGLGVSAVSSLRAAPTIVGLTTATGAVALVSGWWVLPFLGAAVVGTAAVVALAVRKIGGLAGDVLGAVEQIVECLVLVVATGIAQRYDVWWT